MCSISKRLDRGRCVSEFFQSWGRGTFASASRSRYQSRRQRTARLGRKRRPARRWVAVMSEGLIDTNVFLHAQTFDAHAEECLRLLEALRDDRVRARLEPIV